MQKIVYGAMISVFLSLGFFPIAYIIIGRKFDKLFRRRSAFYDPKVPIISSMCRTMQYAQRLLMKDKWIKNIYIRNLYGGYDFQTNSTRLDRVAAWILVGSLLFGLFAIIPSLLVAIWHFIIQL